MTIPADLLTDDDRWLRRVPEATRAFIRERARLRTYHNRATVYAFGDPGDGLYQVVSGMVRLVSYPIVGRQILTLVARRKHWFGELSVVDGGSRPHDALCHGPVTLLHLAMRDIVAFAAKEPTIYGQVALIGCEHQRAALSFIGTMLAKPSKARLVEMILAMLPRADSGDEAATLEMSQEDLAGRIGVSRQHLNNLLADLKRSGGIGTSYGRIHVPDRAALAALAE